MKAIVSGREALSFFFLPCHAPTRGRLERATPISLFNCSASRECLIRLLEFASHRAAGDWWAGSLCLSDRNRLCPPPLPAHARSCLRVGSPLQSSPATGGGVPLSPSVPQPRLSLGINSRYWDSVPPSTITGLSLLYLTVFICVPGITAPTLELYWEN